MLLPWSMPVVCLGRQNDVTHPALSPSPNQRSHGVHKKDLTNGLRKEVSCNPKVQKFLIDVFASCKINIIVDDLVDACRVNENGDFCERLTHSPKLVADNMNVLLSCKSRSTCSDKCTASIKVFRRGGGCCFSALYNSTTPSSSTTSYELWSRCGVDTVVSAIALSVLRWPSLPQRP